MGLESDIKAAFLKSMGNPEDEGNIGGLAKDLSAAVVKWVQAQDFQITEMKAALELETLNTTGNAARGNVGTQVQHISPAGTPTPLIGAAGGVTINPVDWSTKPGNPAGLLQTSGYAYIGSKSPDGSPNEDKTKVKLLEVTPGTE